MKLQILPITLKEANEFVTNFHRHNKKVQGARFCLGASYEDQLVGVAIVGRPVARKWTTDLPQKLQEFAQKKIHLKILIPFCMAAVGEFGNKWAVKE